MTNRAAKSGAGGWGVGERDKLMFIALNVRSLSVSGVSLQYTSFDL